MALSFEELIVFAISNQARSSGSWGAAPQTPANQHNVNVVMLLKSLLFLLKN